MKLTKLPVILTIILLSISLILSAEIPTNQTKSQELYTESAYGIFYIIIIALLLTITILALALILPRIKEYT